MDGQFTIEGPYLGKVKICERIIRSLPEWFGIEDVIQHYAIEINSLPTFLAIEDSQTLGFITFKQHTPYSAEVYVMGIMPDQHRKGDDGKDRDLCKKKASVEYLQVKTLGTSHPDENYAKSRTFYSAMGFRPIEEFTQIWDEHNPCLIMLKRI